MDSLHVSDLTRIATRAAREQSSALQVVGVTGGNGKYAEVIIDLTGCQAEPCRLTVGVFRDTSETDVHDEIAVRLRRHLAAHGLTSVRQNAARPH